MAKYQGYAQPTFTQSSTQKEMLGRTRWVGDRKFVYSQAGAVALAVGKLTIGTAPVSGHMSGMVCAAASIGATEVSVTPTSANVTVNQYKDGYLFFDAAVGTGYGLAYRISANPAITASNVGIISLAEPLRTAITSSTTAGMVPSPQAGVVILPGATATATAHLAGVPPIPVTASYYFWNQVKGPCPVLARGTVVLGNVVIADWTNSSGVAGACIPIASTSSVSDLIKGSIVGQVIGYVATTGYPLINLSITGY